LVYDAYITLLEADPPFYVGFGTVNLLVNPTSERASELSGRSVISNRFWTVERHGYRPCFPSNIWGPDPHTRLRCRSYASMHDFPHLF
jgi:hypothetical protein